MKVAVFCDIEGVSGVFATSFGTPGERHYALGQKYMTDDINACARGLFDAGAEEVLVYDGHGGSGNVLWHDLDQRIILVQGVGMQTRFAGIEEYDALVLLGYHGRAGAEDAILDHTFSSKSVQNHWLNGKLSGEFAIDAAIAGDYGVPVIMTSGDDKLCAEAKEWVADVVACEVKQGLACQCARLLPREMAHQKIYDSAREAYGKIGSIAPLKMDAPVTVRAELIERIPLPKKLSRPGVKFIDARTIEASGNTTEEAFWKLY